MSRFEKSMLGIFLIVSVAAFSVMMKINWMNGQGDDAIFVDILENLYTHKYPKSDLLSTVVDFQSNNVKLLTSEAKEVEKVPLGIKNYNDVNIFHFHFSPIMWIFSYFNRWFSGEWIWSVITSISFLGLLFCVYVYCRREQIGLVLSGLIVILISLHPAWNLAVQGQFYTDRLFIFLGFWLMWEIEKEKRSWIRIMVLTILSAMIIEKVMLMVGALLMGYSILFKRKYIKERLTTFILGVIILGLGVVILKYYINNHYYSSFLSIAQIENFFKNVWIDQTLRNKFFKFTLVNGVWLLFSLRSPKKILLTLGCMIPNIFGNIGGAEKIGFYTHYHSIYFPILIWSGVSGFCTVWKGNKNFRNQIMITILLVIGSIFSYKSDIKPVSWLKAKQALGLYIKKEGYYKYLSDKNKKWDQIVPRGVTISAPESIWVPLFRNRRIFFYPLGIDDVDYVILRYDDFSEVKYRGFVSYLGEENAKQADKLLNERMRKDGFDFENTIKFEGYVIIGRK